MDNMEDIDDSVMDDSIMDISSPTIIDVIDLTKSPSGLVRPTRSRQRSASSNSITDSSDRCRRRRPLSPIVLGNTQDIQMTNLEKRKVPRATSSNEVLTLDNTVKKAETYYTIEPVNREPIPLTCPICLEPLTSNLKPITTRCGHLFCTECLESLIRISKKCPTCKTTITLKSCTRLYL